MSFDREKTQMQKEGSLIVRGLTFRDVGEILTDLGIEFKDTMFVNDKLVTRNWQEELKPCQISWLEQSGLAPDKVEEDV